MNPSVVLFVSRDHGFSVLTELLKSEKYNIIQVFTHALEPKSQNPYNKIRHDFYNFVGTCHNNGIGLYQVDSKDEPLDVADCDFIIEVSWRYLIPKEITVKARKLAFGIHRGKLPDYAGARPILQALEHGDDTIIISAHHLDSKIDMGNVIAEEKYQITKRDEAFIRDDITPLFSRLAFRVMNK